MKTLFQKLAWVVTRPAMIATGMMLGVAGCPLARYQKWVNPWWQTYWLISALIGGLAGAYCCLPTQAGGSQGFPLTPGQTTSLAFDARREAMRQFRLRDLFWLMALVAVALGWWADHRYLAPRVVDVPALHAEIGSLRSQLVEIQDVIDAYDFAIAAGEISRFDAQRAQQILRQKKQQPAP